MINNDQNIRKSTQQGATLITSLVMLVVMTIIGVSTTKVTILEALIVGNDQQKMKLFNDKEASLVKLTSSVKLLPAMAKGLEFPLYNVPNTPDLVTEKIKDMKTKYNCRGISGRATSIGGSGTPVCRMYEFQIFAKADHSSATEIGRRGAGKQVPNDNNGL